MALKGGDSPAVPQRGGVWLTWHPENTEDFMLMQLPSSRGGKGLLGACLQCESSGRELLRSCVMYSLCCAAVSHLVAWSHTFSSQPSDMRFPALLAFYISTKSNFCHIKSSVAAALISAAAAAPCRTSAGVKIHQMSSNFNRISTWKVAAPHLLPVTLLSSRRSIHMFHGSHFSINTSCKFPVKLQLPKLELFISGIKQSSSRLGRSSHRFALSSFFGHWNGSRDGRYADPSTQASICLVISAAARLLKEK